MELDPTLAPNTVNNFISRATATTTASPSASCRSSSSEAIPRFGRGSPGYKFADEPVKGEYTVGAVAMANAGPDTNGSQFFMHDDCRSKQPLYNLFGYVIDGIDVAQDIEQGDDAVADHGARHGLSAARRRTCPRSRTSHIPPPALEEVSDGVYAYVQLDGSWG
jgi:peptidyl-prolyl cis-trans isomerase B (cyclophilin B)